MLRKFAVMGALLWSSMAGADDGTVDFEMFRPFPDAYGYLSMPSAATLGHLQVGGAFWANYSNDPVILFWEAFGMCMEGAPPVPTLRASVHPDASRKLPSFC